MNVNKKGILLSLGLLFSQAAVVATPLSDAVEEVREDAEESLLYQWAVKWVADLGKVYSKPSEYVGEHKVLVSALAIAIVVAAGAKGATGSWTGGLVGGGNGGTGGGSSAS